MSALAESPTAASPPDTSIVMDDGEGDALGGGGDSGQARIIVRTASSRGRRHRQQPPQSAKPQEAACDCGPLCRLLGLRRFPPAGFWFVKDICGLFCAAFTWFLLLYAEYVVLFVVLLPAPSLGFKWINGVIFHVLIALAFVSHCKAMLTDPGAVPLGNATKENILRMGYRDGKDRVIYKCPKCCCIKPERSHHCSVCRRCIRKMDHHCPWVNNCVGETNQKFFVLFNLYICVVSFFAIYMTIHYFVLCIGSEWESCQSGFSPPATTIFLVFLLVEGVLFGLFTAIMCGEQVHGILSDQTGIESLKRERQTWERKSKLVSLESVFGHPFSWRWFSPFSAPNLTNGKHQPYMYSV